ncbi:MAG TPA: hypothetical protein VHD32_17415 [Candidatus Didemnitutus sp.]|nr:hypothetical protein [Candidatus Didemnitutus sp.]
MTPLEKRLADTVTRVLENQAGLMSSLGAIGELLAHRLPGLSPDQQARLSNASQRLTVEAKQNAADAEQLRKELTDHEGPEFPRF